jgi:replication factor C small subunit
VTEEQVYSIASHARPTEVVSLLERCRSSFPEARKQLLTLMLEYGLSGLDVAKQIQSAIWQMEKVPDRTKLEMIKSCGEAEFRMVEGADEYVQLEALLAQFMLILTKESA